MLEIIIPGTPITKKNSQQIVVNKKTGRPFIMPSSQYKKYRTVCLEHINYDGEPIDEPVNIKCVYYMPTKRRVDLVNLLEGSLDILQDAGVIQDDCMKIAYSHDGSRVLYDKENPRVEITIEKSPEDFPF